MSSLRHRLSSFIGLSEDAPPSESDVDSSPNRKESTFSSDSGYTTMATSVSSSSEPSPGRLKKAASATFQAFSNSLRSKTQLFYTDLSNTDPARPTTPQSEVGTPMALREGAKLWGSTRKKVGRSPRSAQQGQSHSPGRPNLRVSVTNEHNDGSPNHPYRRSALWSSIRERANRSPHKDSRDGSPRALRSPVDDLAPSLDVDIPDGSLIVSQLLQRSKSHRRGVNPFSQPKSEDWLDPGNKGNDEDRTIGPGTTVENPSVSQRSVRFLETTPSCVALPQSPTERKRSDLVPTPNENSNEIAGAGVAREDVEFKEPLTPTRPSISSASLSAGQDTFIESPDTPSMGPRSVWNEARADRESRYSALNNLRTDEDTESDSDLDLTRQSGNAPAHRLIDSRALETKSVLDRAESTSSNVRYAIEAIERSPGKAFDDSTASETDASPQRLDPDSDLHYAIEAIERPSGTVYDDSNPPSSAHSPEKPTLSTLSLESTAGGNAKWCYTDSEQPGLETSPVPRRIEHALKSLNVQLLEEPERPPFEAYHCGAMSRSLSSTESLSTTDSCAVTTHDPLCFAPPPYPNLHVRSSPVGSPRDTSETSEAAETPNEDKSLASHDTNKEVKSDPHATALDQSPWSELLFDNDITMKLTAGPLTPEISKKAAKIVDQTKLTKERLSADKPKKPITVSWEELKLTQAPLTPDNPQVIEPADVPLPATPFPLIRHYDLPIRLKEEENSIEAARALARNQESPHFLVDLNETTTPPSTVDALSPNQSSPEKRKKKSAKRKKSLKKLSPSKKEARILAEASGNAGKNYSYSQILKGDRQQDSLRKSFEELAGVEKKGDEVTIKGSDDGRNSGANSKSIAPPEDDKEPRPSSNKKGVSFAPKDEIIEPPSPVLKQKRSTMINDDYDMEIDAEGPAETSTCVSILGEDLMTEEQAGKLWNDKTKAEVARHLMNVVYDLEEMGEVESEREGGFVDGDE